MILQQREQKLQRQQSRKSRLKPSLSNSTADNDLLPGSQSGYWGWRNVAVELQATVPGPSRNDGRRVGVQRVHSSRAERAAKRRSGPTRMRSKTNPERLDTKSPAPRRLQGSFDRLNQLPTAMRTSFDRSRQITRDKRARNGKNPIPRNEWP